MMRTSTSPLGARLPKQIKRALPVYIVLVLVIMLLLNVDSFGSTGRSARHKRSLHRSSHGSQKGVTPKGDRFPRKIWQTWKVDALDFEERDLTTARTWTTKNPSHRYEVLTDNNDLYYVETHFGPDGVDRPDIVDMYRTLTAKIIKADILRYLIMYVEGGIYADIDVEDLKPIDRWIPDRYNEADVDMVISVEIDQPEFKDHPILGKKSQSFCQWTFLSKPGMPVFLQLVENIMDWLNDLAEQRKVPISELALDFDEVISGTGPTAFTMAVLEAMSAREGKTVTWDTFHNLAESKLVGGVLVLTVEAFAAGQGHSDSGTHNARGALVKHHYHASMWPVNHPRYSHPIYGEVERCNWEVQCVKDWDYNKASFDALSPEERAVRLALAEADAQRLAMMPKEEPIAQPQPQAMFPAAPKQQQPVLPPPKPMSPPAHAHAAHPPADAQAQPAADEQTPATPEIELEDAPETEPEDAPEKSPPTDDADLEDDAKPNDGAKDDTKPKVVFDGQS